MTDNWQKNWKVEPAMACVVHLPTGMRVHFVQDAEDSGAWDGRPESVPSVLLERVKKDSGREMARLMREAGDVYHDYLKKDRQ